MNTAKPSTESHAMQNGRDELVILWSILLDVIIGCLLCVTLLPDNLRDAEYIFSLMGDSISILINILFCAAFIPLLVFAMFFAVALILAVVEYIKIIIAFTIIVCYTYIVFITMDNKSSSLALSAFSTLIVILAVLITMAIASFFKRINMKYIVNIMLLVIFESVLDLMTIAKCIIFNFSPRVISPLVIFSTLHIYNIYTNKFIGKDYMEYFIYLLAILFFSVIFARLIKDLTNEATRWKMSIEKAIMHNTREPS